MGSFAKIAVMTIITQTGKGNKFLKIGLKSDNKYKQIQLIVKFLFLDKIIITFL